MPAVDQLFEERKLQTGYWFTEDLTPAQQATFLQFFATRCLSPEHARLLSTLLRHDSAPQYNALESDASRLFPRAVVIRIFSFLDPRSLVRAGATCWAWRALSSLDVLWKPLCLRHKWLLPYVPSAHEQGAWRAHYRACVEAFMRKIQAAANAAAELAAAKENFSSLAAARQPAAASLPKYTYTTLPSTLHTPTNPPWRALLATSDEPAADMHDAEYPSTWPDTTMLPESGRHEGLSPPRLARTFQRVKGLLQKSDMIRNDDATAAYEPQPTALQAFLRTSVARFSNGEPMARGDLVPDEVPEPPIVPRSLATFDQAFPGARRVEAAADHECAPELDLLLLPKATAARPAARRELPDAVVRIVLISSEMSLAPLLLKAARLDVTAQLYDYSVTSPASLLALVDSLLPADGQGAHHLAFVGHGRPGLLRLCAGMALSETGLESAAAKSFWRDVSSRLRADGTGKIELFSPHFCDNIQGCATLARLERLTGIAVAASNDLCGAVQYLDWALVGQSRPLRRESRLYFTDAKIDTWLRLVEGKRATISALAQLVASQYSNYSREMALCVMGEVLDALVGEDDRQLQSTAPLLVEALSEMLKFKPADPLQYLASFFSRPKSLAGVLTQATQGLVADGLGWPPAEDPPGDVLVESLEERRQRLVGELLRLEAKFVDKLEYLRQTYMLPAQKALAAHQRHAEKSAAAAAAAASPKRVQSARGPVSRPQTAAKLPQPSSDEPAVILSETSFRAIFTDIQAVLSVHQRLVADLQLAVQMWQPESGLGAVYGGSRVTALRVHVDVAHNLNSVFATVSRCVRESAPFRALFVSGGATAATSDSKPESTKKTSRWADCLLPELLRLPSGHFPRLVALLERVLTCTSPAHADYATLKTAVAALQATQTTIRKFETAALHSERAQALAERISGLPTTLANAAPHCSLDARVVEVVRVGRDACPRWSPVQELHLFVCGGAFLVVALVLPVWTGLGAIRSDQCQFKQAVPLSHVTVLGDGGDDPARPHVAVLRLGGSAANVGGLVSPESTGSTLCVQFLSGSAKDGFCRTFD